jgi:uncharacterized protein (DUF1800 family)
MGVYLSFQGNKKADLIAKTRPDENYARELMQLFTIGLYNLNIDGSTNYDGNSNTYPDTGTTPIATFNEVDIQELAKIMTGWDLKNNPIFGEPQQAGDYMSPMVFHSAYHEDEIAESGDGNVTLLGTNIALNSGVDGSGIDAALDTLFNHPNVAPFVSRHLIMNLVTSNPSSAYVARVASIFNNNGHGLKGDLKTVVRSILTDPEARNINAQSVPIFGKIKEPLLAWTQLLRTFNVQPFNGWNGIDHTSTTRFFIDNIYMYVLPEQELGQGPFRSPSVFNFYQPDYVPRNDFFANNHLVAPEIQIQSGKNIVNYNNAIHSFLQERETNQIVRINQKNLTEFAATRWPDDRYLMLINFDRELRLFEQALDGDTNGNFANMNTTDPTSNIPYKDKAVDALLVHLDKILLGNTMTTKYKTALRQFLLNGNDFSSTDTFRNVHAMIRDTVRYIVTSSAYMTQK